VIAKALKKKRKDDDQVPLNVDTDVSRGDYTGNLGSYAEINNSDGEDQPYVSRSGSTSPLQTSPHSPLGFYSDSRHNSSHSRHRRAVEQDSPSLPPREYQHGLQRTHPHSDFIPCDNRTSQYVQDGQDQEVCGQRDWYAYHMSSSTNSSYHSFTSVVPPTSLLLSYPVVPTPPACAAGHPTKGITTWLTTTLRR